MNRWDFWTYPRQLDTTAPPNITVSSELDAATIASLEQGGRVLLLLPPERVDGTVKPRPRGENVDTKLAKWYRTGRCERGGGGAMCLGGRGEVPDGRS